MIDHDGGVFTPEVPTNEAYAQAVTAELRQVLQPDETRYAEIHLVDKTTPYLLVNPRKDRAYDASILGYHSVADTIRNYEAADFPDFVRYVDDPEHTLTSKTILAKGEFALTEADNLQLRLDRHTRKGYPMSQLLSFLFNNAQKWGIDELGMIDDKDIVTSIDMKAEELRSAYFTPQYIGKKELGENQYSKEIRCGIIDKVITEPASWSGQGNGSLAPRSTMQIHAVEAEIPLHTPLREYLSSQGKSGFVPIRWEGQTEYAYITYVIDGTSPTEHFLTILFSQETVAEPFGGNIYPRHQRLAQVIQKAFLDYSELDEANVYMGVDYCKTSEDFPKLTNQQATL